ncbi:alpha-1,3-mannosyltransferase [Sphingomonas xinjiangensis]|uniref:Alpha-1,3-mannosyltransferase n=1 Tax=Sphingomonas xinjiangensis TaxID=643568 RepID=A0A840YRC2_9SPHN|nr:alpha-1,3-mannosyltransferase [Sphingomonas xinjiangensis]
MRQYHPVIGGLENTVASLIDALRAQGVQGSVVTLNRNFQDHKTRLEANSEINGFPVTRIPYFGSSRYPIAPRVLATLKGADIVHVHGVDFFFDYLASTRRIHGKHLVASTHGGFFHTTFANHLKKAYFNTITRASSRSYETIIGSSDNDAAMFQKVAPNNTVSIENGVDVGKWHNCASSTPTTSLLALGRFSSNKALPDLIAIVSSLGAPWRLIVAGQNSDLTGDELRVMAEAHGVADRVQVHVGLNESEIRSLIARATYLTSASRYEGFGLTAVEGLSAGLIPILNDIPPFQKVISNAGVGSIANMSKPSEAAQLIRDLHEDVTRSFSKMREKAIQASMPFSWESVASRFAYEYAKIMSKNG